VSKQWAFDLEHSVRISQKREEFLRQLLDNLNSTITMESALDAGCGVGYFSSVLVSMGLKVTAFDVRQENVEEARRRQPNVQFLVQDVEDTCIAGLSEFDLVLCFGLLYHLENPFRAVRNLHAITRKVLIIESMVAPFQLPAAVLMNENPGQDQGTHHVAFVPSQACLVKILYHAGFPYVCETTVLPGHDDFRDAPSHVRRRTILVASKVRLRSPLLRPIPEPQPQRLDIWRRV